MEEKKNLFQCMPKKWIEFGSYHSHTHLFVRKMYGKNGVKRQTQLDGQQQQKRELTDVRKCMQSHLLWQLVYGIENIMCFFFVVALTFCAHMWQAHEEYILTRMPIRLAGIVESVFVFSSRLLFFVFLPSVVRVSLVRAYVRRCETYHLVAITVERVNFSVAFRKSTRRIYFRTQANTFYTRSHNTVTKTAY